MFQGLTPFDSQALSHRAASALLLIVLLAAAACGRSPLAPDDAEPQRSPAADLATISGWVYANVDWANPPLADALIEVRAADGSRTRVVSDSDGFYEASVRPGTILVVTSKEGHETTAREVTVLTHTVLNFFLAPS